MFLHTITGACTPVCLLAAIDSVETVTPPFGAILTMLQTACERATSTLAAAGWKSIAYQLDEVTMVSDSASTVRLRAALSTVRRRLDGKYLRPQLDDSSHRGRAEL
jgi:hypothetical protein